MSHLLRLRKSFGDFTTRAIQESCPSRVERLADASAMISDYNIAILVRMRFLDRACVCALVSRHASTYNALLLSLSVSTV